MWIKHFFKACNNKVSLYLSNIRFFYVDFQSLVFAVQASQLKPSILAKVLKYGLSWTGIYFRSISASILWDRPGHEAVK